MVKQFIYIDAGHGGADPGAVGATAREKDIALAVALQVGQALIAQGFGVCYSRTTDKRILVGERTRLANRTGAAALVSIHCNAAANKAARGAETYAYNKACKGYLLAQHIQSNLVQRVKMLDRGVKTANFAVLRDTAMPAALVELGFLSNAMEEQIMLDRAWQQQAAAAIAVAIAQYLA